MAELQRRRLGRTGLMVTELGLGAMDTPESPERYETVNAAIEAGIDVVDSGRDYAGSEFLLGQVIRERGEKPFYVGTKTFSRNVNGSQWDVDKSVNVLGVDCVDLYQLHDVSTPEAWDEVMTEGQGALEGLKVAQFRGLIGHIGISSHSEEILEKAITSGEFDTVMLEYSAFYPDTARLIDLAQEHDVGVIVMRPVGGSGRTSTMRGRMEEGTAGIVTPANLLRYVLSHPGVSVAIPGARHPSRIHDNVATATSYTPMDEAEKRELEEAAAAFY